MQRDHLRFPQLKSSCSTMFRDRLMDVMEEVVVQKVSQFSSTDNSPEDWTCAARRLGESYVPACVPEAEIIKAANAGTEEPVPVHCSTG